MIFNGDKLRQLREAKLWTKLELAKRLAVSSPQVGRWESAEAVPRGAMIKKMSRVLGCPISDLVTEDPMEFESVEQEIA
jgi:transcriptional regulator with XRE-family HTH domain